MDNMDMSQEKILRFRKSERTIHWATAVPFIVCYASALVLVFYYNPDPSRPFRNIFSWMHQISGICLVVLPVSVMLRNRRDFRLYLYNIKQAWVWTLEDVKWLFLRGLATVSIRVSLPAQGKFNAAEKLNFMMLVSTCPLYLVTGLFIWLTDSALMPWIIHINMSVIATPLLFGHIFMATVNPHTRAALPGMFSGYVDRHYVKHHHSLWYMENFEGTADSVKAGE